MSLQFLSGLHVALHCTLHKCVRVFSQLTLSHKIPAHLRWTIRDLSVYRFSSLINWLYSQIATLIDIADSHSRFSRPNHCIAISRNRSDSLKWKKSPLKNIIISYLRPTKSSLPLSLCHSLPSFSLMCLRVTNYSM